MMKKTMLVLAVFTGLSTAVLAQEPAKVKGKGGRAEMRKDMTPEERAKKGANHAEKKLGLTEQQKADWEIAALKRNMVNQPLHEKLKGSTTPEERKELHKQIRENNQNFENTVNALLTEEQKSKFIQLKEERRNAKKKEMKKNFDEAHMDYGD
jgi:hypothetical protein